MINNSLIKLLMDKSYVIPNILISNYRELGINDSELIILIILMSFTDRINYNPNQIAKMFNGSKLEVMNIINNLCDKNIITIEIEKVNKKAYEYISLELLYQKLINTVVSEENDKIIEEKSLKVFDVFERELGRTLSSFEYGQIQEWLSSGNTEELVICALKEAVLNGVGNLRYIDSILRDWEKKGYKKEQDIIKDKEMYRAKKEKVQIGNTDWDWIND